MKQHSHLLRISRRPRKDPGGPIKVGVKISEIQFADSRYLNIRGWNAHSGGWASNGVSFTVTGNPYIENVTPNVAAAGSTVTINGSSFGASQGSSTVTFNGTAATAIVSWSSAGTQIQVAVPSGATTGNVVITVGGVASNGYAFALGTTVYYYFADQLGTSRVMTDSNGTICYDADFYPFGGERDYTNNCTQNYKFIGKERDSESGLDNFGARYDSWQYGRFMSPNWSAKAEPVPYAKLGNPQSLNLYAYVDNNPTTLTDPDGHCSQNGGQEACTAVILNAVREGADPLVAMREVQDQQAQNNQNAQQASKPVPVVVVTSDTTHPAPLTPGVVERERVYTPGTMDSNGNVIIDRSGNSQVTLTEKRRLAMTIRRIAHRGVRKRVHLRTKSTSVVRENIRPSNKISELTISLR